MIRELNAEEKTYAIARFAEQPEVGAAAEVVDAFKETMSASDAVMPDAINEIFSPASQNKNGCCMIPYADGKDGAYATFHTFFPGTSVEQLYWWFGWRGLCSVNYTVSNSAHNHSIAMSEEHKRKLCDPFLPEETKIRGVIQSAVKDTGKCGLEDFIIHLQRPEEMEVDVKAATEAGCGFVGGWWMREDRASNQPYKKGIDMFAHVLRQQEDGVAVQSFIWCGYRGLKGHNIRMDTYGPVIDEEYARQIGLAEAQEMAQLAAILPELYEAAAN